MRECICATLPHRHDCPAAATMYRYESGITELMQAVAEASSHAPYNSAHEGFAVILEEVDELWDEVKKKRSLRDKARMRAEAMQIAACAFRFAIDVCRPE